MSEIATKESLNIIHSNNFTSIRTDSRIEERERDCNVERKGGKETLHIASEANLPVRLNSGQDFDCDSSPRCNGGPIDVSASPRSLVVHLD